MHYDLIVIGMGLSGLMAAKTAADAGQKVLIVGKGTGSLGLFSNTIDLLGDLPGQMTATEGLAQWIQTNPHHPYSTLGPDRIREALSSFTSLFPPPYSFHTMGDKNCLIPTAAGTLRPTYLIPTTMVAGASHKEGDSLIVGFEGFKDFYAHYVADLLKCRGVTLKFPQSLQREMTATALARQMERHSSREIIGEEIRKRLKGETRVGLPAVLGLYDPIQVKRDLEERIGAEIFEIPTLPPSIPGKRIFDRFRESLIRKGVTWILGQSISKAASKGKICETVSVSHAPLVMSYSADRFILASGRFLGGGLVADQEKITEPIFNLPVFQPGSREGWFTKSFFGDHAIHRVGIRTDRSLRPIDERGSPAFENVWVAGSILAYHNSINQKSREGIEIATGYMAAKWASEK